MKELVAAAKAKPGELTFASTGVGSPPHLTLELFQSAAGVKFVHVPYRGAAPALTDLLGGQVQVFAADAPVLMSQIKGGKIRALGAASGQRNPMLPDVPTLAEQGYPNTIVDNWYGLLAPAKTPPADHRQAQRRVRQGDQRSGGEAEADRFRRGPGGRHAGRVRQVLQGGVRPLGQGRPRARHQGGEADAQRFGRYSPVAGSRRSVGTPARSGSLTRTGLRGRARH